MEPSHHPDPAGFRAIPAAEERLLSGADRRMATTMWIVGIAAMPLCWLWQGWRGAGGFAIGAVLSAVNFRWMKGAVSSLATLASQTASALGEPPPRPAGSAGMAIRIVLRYALIGAGAYVIFKSSIVSLGAFFAGLFLYLAAILVEVAYEIFYSIRNA